LAVYVKIKEGMTYRSGKCSDMSVTPNIWAVCVNVFYWDWEIFSSGNIFIHASHGIWTSIKKNYYNSPHQKHWSSGPEPVKLFEPVNFSVFIQESDLTSKFKFSFRGLLTKLLLYNKVLWGSGLMTLELQLKSCCTFNCTS
jgi:hypothetical protein